MGGQLKMNQLAAWKPVAVMPAETSKVSFSPGHSEDPTPGSRSKKTFGSPVG
jgi:hypothetical protein